MELIMPQVITQLKIVAWLYILCSIVTFSILIISFMQGRLFFYFNNANCAVECFTNPLDQSIPNVVELHKEYAICHENNIIKQEDNAKQAKQLAHTEKEKSDLFIKLDETVEDRDACKQKLNTYKTYLDFIGSIDLRIKSMDTCNSYLKIHCDCLKDKDSGCADRYFKYLSCESALPQNYHDAIRDSYNTLLDDVMMVKKNLTHLLIKGDFEMMKEIYEQKKNLPTDNCHFICSLNAENVNTQHNATHWKAFTEGWKLFSKYFLE